MSKYLGLYDLIWINIAQFLCRPNNRTFKNLSELPRETAKRIYCESRWKRLFGIKS